MEANKAFVRPYLRFCIFSNKYEFFLDSFFKIYIYLISNTSYHRVAHSYKMLENYNMSALALMKAKAMPITEPNTVQAIKTEIVRELAEVADEAKVAARDYMQRKGINNASKLDLQAARAARYCDELSNSVCSKV